MFRPITLARYNVSKRPTYNRPNRHSYLHTRAVYWKSDAQEDVECTLVSFRPPDPTNHKPLQALTVNDTTTCKAALRHLRNGKVLIYTGPGGDYHNARQLLRAVKKRLPIRMKNQTKNDKGRCMSIKQQWMEQRRLQQVKSEIVNKILVKISLCDNRPSEILDLKRTPVNTDKVLTFAFQNDRDIDLSSVENKNANNVNPNFFLLSLNDFLAMVGAYEWHKKGVYINALQNFIHPHFGVFPPTRQDYIELLNFIQVDRTQKRPIKMLEVGIGSGVLSIILLQRNKVDRVVGTDINPYAIACARDNFQRFGLCDKVDLIQTNLFPTNESGHVTTAHKYDVVLFNPHWIPGIQATALDQAVYDTSDQSILKRFLSQVHCHVKPDGDIYLLFSNLGMLLGLFTEQDLHELFKNNNLEVAKVFNTKSKVELMEKSQQIKQIQSQQLSNVEDAKANEVISLYHLRHKPAWSLKMDPSLGRQ